MSRYRRNYQTGGYYFFTLVTYQRTPYLANTNNIQILKESFQKVKMKYPFKTNAFVVLPDHLHCLWHLPGKDQDYSKRWRLIKSDYSKKIDTDTNHRHEKNIWQKRFWEHTIRNIKDWRNHIDYIHYNPVKHGLVPSPKDWQHSSFHHWVEQGAYNINWGASNPPFLNDIHPGE